MCRRWRNPLPSMVKRFVSQLPFNHIEATASKCAKNFVRYLHSVLVSGMVGSSTTPGRPPDSRIICTVRWRCGQISTWIASRSAPGEGEVRDVAFRVLDHQVHARGRRVDVRAAWTTSGPMVMFGKKCPSMTSTWIQSAPVVSTAWSSSPSRARSVDRMGERSVCGGTCPRLPTDAFKPNQH